jgi:prephenate dehydrogenase
MTKIAVIGTGLIGTSLGLALKQAQIKNLELVGTDYDHAARSGAEKRQAFDRVEGRILPAVRDADIVILATPIMAMQDLFQTIGTELSDGCIVTDVGSSKRVVLDWAAQYLPKGVEFVGGHPMAGKETRGPETAEADLFRGKAYCIVPAEARQQAVSEVTKLAEAVGARPFFVGVNEHDSFVAAASHLPFLVSVALMGCTSKSANWEDIAQLASTGYRDITRLASGDPIMHRDICLSNPEPIVAWIDTFIRELYEVRKMLDNQEQPATKELQQVFQQAHDSRSGWLAGLVTPAARQQVTKAEIPTFAETMGQMFMGRKGMEMQRRFFKGMKDPDRKDR